jgi:protein gp37
MDEFSHLNEAEKLKAGNEFLKMKLVLEMGSINKKKAGRELGGRNYDEMPSIEQMETMEF